MLLLAAYFNQLHDTNKYRWRAYSKLVNVLKG